MFPCLDRNSTLEVLQNRSCYHIACYDGLCNPPAINFIPIADLTASTDLGSNVDIHLAGVDTDVDVFELPGDGEQIDSSEKTRLRIVQDADDTARRKPISSTFRTGSRGFWDS